MRLDEHVLLVQEHFWGQPQPRDWAFPGGTRERDEDICTALRREFWEETGLKLGDIGSVVQVFGDFVLFEGFLAEQSCAELLSKVKKQGYYAKDGVEGEKIRITLADGRTLASSGNADYVSMSFGLRKSLRLAFRNQLKTCLQ